MAILEYFSDSLAEGKLLAVMPISRLLIEEKICVGDYVLCPPHELDVETLRPVPNRTITDASSLAIPMREALSSCTGFDINTLLENPALVFMPDFDVDWHGFIAQEHQDDISVLRRLNQQAEVALDVACFDTCTFDLPDLVPGRVGSWNGSGAFWGALLYNPTEHESYLIAGAAATTSVVRGLGLQLESAPNYAPPGNGEVGSIARHALSLFRDVLEASTETHRFMRAMTLFEFLAAPDSFMKMQKVKTEIAAHIAHDKKSYHNLSERFKSLTSYLDADGIQRGIRTLIVHQGRYLESLIPSESERCELFRELHDYCYKVLDDMLRRQGWTWTELVAFRRDRRIRMGVESESN